MTFGISAQKICKIAWDRNFLSVVPPPIHMTAEACICKRLRLRKLVSEKGYVFESVRLRKRASAKACVCESVRLRKRASAKACVCESVRLRKRASAKACVCESVRHRKRVLGVAKHPREISSAQPRRQNSYFFRKMTKP